MYEALARHFLALPDETFIREVWHTHTQQEIARYMPKTDFADRALRLLGCNVPALYSQYSKTQRERIYLPKWLPIEADPEVLQRYAEIFYNVNVYTTLNTYPKSYALARTRLFEQEYRLRRAKSMPQIFDAEKLAELEAARARAAAAISEACYVDIGIDIDVNPKAGVPDLETALGHLRTLADFCEKYSVPHLLYFSGGRSFHLAISHTVLAQPLAEHNHRANKRLIELVFKETGELPIDWSLFSRRRQYRLPGSRHGKTGLYKIDLSRDELELGIAHITGKACFPPENVRFLEPAPENEYLARLFALANAEVDQERRYQVKPTAAKRLLAHRKLAAQTVGQAAGGIDLSKLQHPPCIQDALANGIKDPARSNRNLVTVMLASYFKAIGATDQDTKALLVPHALQILAPFSGSGPATIEQSTHSAIDTVYRYERYQFNCGQARAYGFRCDDRCALYKSHRPRTTTRTLKPVPISGDIEGKATPTGPVFADIQTLRQDLTEKVTSYVAAAQGAVAENASAIRPLLIRAPAGAGKTITVFKWLATRSLRTLWVGSRLDLFENIPQEAGGQWLRIEGRHGEIAPSNSPVIPATCSYPKIAARLRDKRLNVNDHLCRRCSERDFCRYFRQFKDTEHHWFVQQPTFQHKVRDFVGRFDLVVLDEDIMGQFLESVRVELDDVRTLKGYVEGLAEDLAFIGLDENLANYGPLLELLSVLEELLDHAKPPVAITGEILHHELELAFARVKGAGRIATAQSFKDLVAAIPTTMDGITSRLFLLPEETDKPLPLAFLDVLLPLLRYELLQRPPESNLSRIRLKPRHIAPPIHDPKAKGRFVNRLELYVRAPTPPLTRPYLILDATGKAEIYEQLLGKPPAVYAPRLRFENPVRQVYSASGSITSLRQPLHRKRMLSALKHLLDEEPHTLVIAKKRLVKTIKPLLPKEAAITHFYGTRGSNAYRDFRRVIVFGMPGLSPEQILIYASAFFYNLNLTTAAGPVLKRYPGHNVGVEVYCYADPRIQSIAETAREDEIVQSAYRIRPLLDREKEIVLLTNLVISELPVTELVSLDELIRPTGSRPQILLREVVERQIDILGFVAPKLTLFALFVHGYDEETILAALQARGVAPVIPEAQKMSARTLRRRFAKVALELNLKCAELRIAHATGAKRIDVYGTAADFRAHAARFSASVGLVDSRQAGT